MTRGNIFRMINVFGCREMELAAIRILDQRWEQPFKPVPADIFKEADEREGFAELKRMNWIDRDGTPTRQFWSRVHER